MGENKRVSERERERTSEKKEEWETERKKEPERETHHGAQERERERKRERELLSKRERERASEGNRDREWQRERVREKEERRESTMWYVMHTAIPNGTRLPCVPPYPSTFKTITLVHLSGNEIFSGLETTVSEGYLQSLHLCKWAAVGISLNCILID